MFLKCFNKCSIIFIGKTFKFFESEQLSIFNESIIIYRKTQKVKKKDFIEKQHEKMEISNFIQKVIF